MSETRPKLELVPIGAKVEADGVVIVLEDMLERARKGEIVAIALAGITHDRCSITTYYVGEQATMLVGATYRLLRRVEECNS